MLLEQSLLFKEERHGNDRSAPHFYGCGEAAGSFRFQQKDISKHAQMWPHASDALQLDAPHLDAVIDKGGIQRVRNAIDTDIYMPPCQDTILQKRTQPGDSRRAHCLPEE